MVKFHWHINLFRLWIVRPESREIPFCASARWRNRESTSEVRFRVNNISIYIQSCSQLFELTEVGFWVHRGWTQHLTLYSILLSETRLTISLYSIFLSETRLTISPPLRIELVAEGARRKRYDMDTRGSRESVKDTLHGTTVSRESWNWKRVFCVLGRRVG